ncbi:MAG: hypothetical protein ACK559_28860, partial [bacterium]
PKQPIIKKKTPQLISTAIMIHPMIEPPSCCEVIRNMHPQKMSKTPLPLTVFRKRKFSRIIWKSQNEIKIKKPKKLKTSIDFS